MNNMEDINYINRLYDELTSCRSNLMTELKNDKEAIKERVLNSKIIIIDSLLKNILKYRNITIRDKQKADGL